MNSQQTLQHSADFFELFGYSRSEDGVTEPATGYTRWRSFEIQFPATTSPQDMQAMFGELATKIGTVHGGSMAYVTAVQFPVKFYFAMDMDSDAAQQFYFSSMNLSSHAHEVVIDQLRVVEV